MEAFQDGLGGLGTFRWGAVEEEGEVYKLGEIFSISPSYPEVFLTGMNRLSFSTALVCGAILLLYELNFQQCVVSFDLRRFTTQLLRYQSMYYDLIHGYSRSPAVQPRAKMVVVERGSRLEAWPGGKIRKRGTISAEG